MRRSAIIAMSALIVMDDKQAVKTNGSAAFTRPPTAA